MVEQPHRIVVVGGGAAGLELVTKLGDGLGRRGRAEITLVDRSRRHMWKPLLHEVAAGSIHVGHHEVDYLGHAHRHHFRYRIGAMTGLDRAARLVHLDESRDAEGEIVTPKRSLPYDTLVIAVGSSSNDFGTPGVQAHAIALDTLVQAERFHQRLLNRMIRANTQEGPVRPGQLHVAIIGAGATGTELAAELHRTTRQVAAHGLDRIDPDKDLKITLIEAAPRVLPALPEKLSNEVARLLRKIGVEIRTAARVTEVSGEGVKLADGGFVPSELTVWAAGVKAPDFLADLDGLEVTRTNLLMTTQTLQTTRDENVFAIGDCAYLIPEGSDTPLPPRAQTAHQQASHLLAQLPRRIAGKPLQPFRYRDFGSLVNLGEHSTVGNLAGLVRGRGLLVQGAFARLMYKSLYKMHQQALHGAPTVAIESAARMLTRRTEARVKLH